MLCVLVVACLLPLAGCYSLNDVQGKVTVRERYPTTLTSTVFGSGYNTAALRRTFNKVVDVDRPHLLSTFIESTYKITLCKTRDDYFRSLEVGLGFTGTYMGVTGSVKVKALTEARITSLDTVLIATVNAITDTQISTSARFNNASSTLLSEKKYQEFIDVFGTHYLRKVILGGKMVLVMKFSSSTTESKKGLEATLGVYVGTVGADTDFALKLGELREKSTMELTLYAQGSNLAPPRPEIQEGFDYAVNFATNILTNPAVIEVEYTGLWTLPDAPEALRDAIFTVQGKTDQLVSIATGLASAVGELEDLEDLRKTSTAHISPKGWRQIMVWKQYAKRTLRGLQNEFKTVSVSKYDEILAKYSGTDVKLVGQIEILLEDEARYQATDYFTLRSIKSRHYISTLNRDGYPRLDIVAPIALKFIPVEGNKEDVLYGEHVMITTLQYPGKFLCMNHLDSYPMFQDLPGIEKTRCQYRVVGRSKKVLQYGDDVLLYNKYWKDFLLGVEDNWLKCIEGEYSDDYRHHWYMGKTNF